MFLKSISRDILFLKQSNIVYLKKSFNQYTKFCSMSSSVLTFYLNKYSMQILMSSLSETLFTDNKLKRINYLILP